MPTRSTPPEFEQEGDVLPVKDIRELGLSAKEQSDLLRYADQAQMYASAKREASKALDGLSSAIKTLLSKADVGRSKIMVGTVPLTYYSTERRTLKPELLLNFGVTPAVIAKCTTVSTSWSLKVGGDE